MKTPDRLPAVFSWPRFLTHLPIGLIAGWCLLYATALGFGILIYFALYEISEDAAINDHMYIDVIGAVVGLCAVAVIDMVWRML